MNMLSVVLKLRNYIGPNQSVTLKTQKKTLKFAMKISNDLLRRNTKYDPSWVVEAAYLVPWAIKNTSKLPNKYFLYDKNLLVCIRFFGFIQSNTNGTHPSVSCAYTAFYASSVKRTAATSANYPNIHFGMTNPAIFVVIVLEN